MVRLGESRRLLSWQPGPDELAAEPPHAPLPPSLESYEADADLHRQEGNRRHHDDREAVAVAGHHSSPLPRDEIAFAIMPPRFSDDMYCSVSLKACSSVIPLSLSVR